MRMASARGRVYAIPEEREGVPQTAAQIAGNIDQMLESQNPQIQASVTDPLNLQAIANAKQLPEWHIPGLDQMKNVKRMIQQLMASEPTPGPPQPDPQTGQMVPGPPQASYPFDADFDDPQITVTVIKEWAATQEGLQARMNPNFENLRLYLIEAMNALNPPKPPVTKPTLADDAGNALVAALASPDVDKAGVIAEKTLEGLGVLTPKAPNGKPVMQ